jgi:hypothetical protein
MNNLDLALIEAFAPMSALESTIDKGLSTQQEVTVVNILKDDLYNLGFLGRESLVIAHCFIEHTYKLGFGDEMWSEVFIATVEEATIDGESVDVELPIIDSLVELGYVSLNDDEYTFGLKLETILSRTFRRHAPVLASVGINEENRVHAYGKRLDHVSSLEKEAIHILESVECKVNQPMLAIAQEVMSRYEATNRKFKKDYVVNGCAQLTPEAAYVTEFKLDKRGRLYQAAFHGYNGQSSDLARSLQDLHGLDNDYDVDEAMELLLLELDDMVSVPEGYTMDDIIESAVTDPVTFIVKNWKNIDSPVKKPWNFVKFSQLLSELMSGNKPYIGVAVGYDAKCSGPQLGALMTGSQQMLEATGFTTKGSANVKDAYQVAIEACDEAGLSGLTRSDMKKPFMAIFYGAGTDAMMDKKTIESGAYNTLYNT